jgi:basic amino acid/polyamine antiporter, APA family
LCLWGLLGLESATVPADKVRDAQHTVPRATMVGTSATGLVYLIACSAIILMMPATDIASSNAPFADFADHFAGGDSGRWLAAFAAISCFGALNGWILLQAEIPFAMARSGVFPAFLAVQSSRGTPVRAHLLASALMSFVVLMNYSKSMAQLFQFIILVSTSASLVMYLICCLAALRLRADGRLTMGSLSMAVAALAAIYALWTIYGAGLEALSAFTWLLLLGLLLYLGMRFFKPSASAR